MEVCWVPMLIRPFPGGEVRLRKDEGGEWVAEIRSVLGGTVHLRGPTEEEAKRQVDLYFHDGGDPT